MRVADLESFQQVVRQRVPMVGSIARGNSELALPVRAPVIRGGALRFVVVAVIRPDAIRDQLLAAELPPEWTGTVIDSAGRVVARTKGSETILGAPASTLALKARTLAPEGIYEGRLLEGIPTVSAFYTSQRTGWSVHIGIPHAVFNAPLVRAIWLSVAGGVASIALAAVFLFSLLRELSLRRRKAIALENAQRMEALGRMTGGIAHDINNLLTVVSGNLEILERRLPGAAGGRSVDAIRTAVERGASLTRGLLTFTRDGLTQSKTENVNECIRDVFNMMSDALGTEIVIKLDLEDPMPFVLLDRVQFDLALLNLAVNARDAMPNGGTLSIATRTTLLRDRTPGVAIIVTDNGRGIPAEVLPHVFEPFFTTKEVGEGSGVGLTQVYGFARSVGGIAEITSRVEIGTTVTILLPETEGEAETKSDRQAASPLKIRKAGGDTARNPAQTPPHSHYPPARGGIDQAR